MAITAAALSVAPLAAQEGIRADEWAAYQAAFVTPEGRVVDTINGNISHSESQGYGLVLAVMAGDRPSFERIWTFTRTELLIRDDGLAAWRWDPNAEPHVADVNNATDGDVLIAYGLALGGKVWGDAALTEAATDMVKTIGRTMLVASDGLPAILPGQYGFLNEGQPAVVNPSYWIFETMPLFAELDPAVDWNAVSLTGQELVRRAGLTETGIPADWVVMQDGGVAAAEMFPPEFGYNGIRVPLYLMRAGLDPALLDGFRRNADEAGMRRVDVETGAVLETMGEPGYKLIEAAMACTVEGTMIPAEAATFAATTYYGSTLQLLLLDHLRRNKPECLPAGGAP